jgi:hypothetical protein
MENCIYKKSFNFGIKIRKPLEMAIKWTYLVYTKIREEG